MLGPYSFQLEDRMTRSNNRLAKNSYGVHQIGRWLQFEDLLQWQPREGWYRRELKRLPISWISNCICLEVRTIDFVYFWSEVLIATNDEEKKRVEWLVLQCQHQWLKESTLSVLVFLTVHHLYSMFCIWNNIQLL